MAGRCRRQPTLPQNWLIVLSNFRNPLMGMRGEREMTVKTLTLERLIWCLGRGQAASAVGWVGLVFFVASATPAAGQDAFTGFIKGLRDVCAEKPAAACTERVTAYLDVDNDKLVSLDEFETVRDLAKIAVANGEKELSATERNLIAIGLLTLQHAKLDNVFAKFDTDGNGGLSEQEMFADFEVDQRPFGDIVADPDSVDWPAFAERFGKVGFLVMDLLPPSHRR